jgi:hypothetical protein
MSKICSFNHTKFIADESILEWHNTFHLFTIYSSNIKTCVINSSLIITNTSTYLLLLQFVKQFSFDWDQKEIQIEAIIITVEY